MTKNYEEIDESSPNDINLPSEHQIFGAHHDEYIKVLLDIENQRLIYRRYVGLISLVIVILFLILECVIVNYILKFQANSSLPELFVIFAISPIVSVTLILIFALKSVFGSHHDMNAERAARFFTGLFSGGQ